MFKVIHIIPCIIVYIYIPKNILFSVYVYNYKWYNMHKFVLQCIHCILCTVHCVLHNFQCTDIYVSLKLEYIISQS